MEKKEFVNYIDFLKLAFKYKDSITNFKYHDGRLYSFRTSNLNCKFLIDNGVLTPNKFMKLLGFENYNAFVNKKFSKLKEFANNEKDYQKWYGGFFGGLVGVNRHIINDYVGQGEIFEFYDYDINKAYLHALTGWLPTKFIKTMKLIDYMLLNECDKIPYIYFFEIQLKTIKTDYLKAIGTIKEIYKSFDFLNSKQGENIIVSERRLNLINQIYFKDYEIKNVFVFERGKFALYQRMLDEYLRVKDQYGAEFKKNALRLYGTFGQINKYKATKLSFDKDGTLIVNYNREDNILCSPQVSMYIADSVAERLFSIISNNLDKVICWNTDGITSLKPLNLKISKKAGLWKCKKITATPFLFNDTGSRLFFKDVLTNSFYGATNIIEEDGKIYETVEFSYSNINKGFVVRNKKFEIPKNITFNEINTFRNRILKMKLVKEVIREYEKF